MPSFQCPLMFITTPEAWAKLLVMRGIMLWGGRDGIIYLEIVPISSSVTVKSCMEEIAHRKTLLPAGSMTQCSSLAVGSRTGTSSPMSEFLFFGGFKPYVDSPNLWCVFYSWNINPENREWWWKLRPRHDQTMALVGTTKVTDLQLGFKYFIELQKGLLLGSLPFSSLFTMLFHN